jgi:hypothetical protein
MEKNEMGGSCSTYGGEERRGALKVLVGSSEGKKPLSHRWEDNIKIDLQEVGCGAWIGLM